MLPKENYISFDYQQLNFLLPKENIETALSFSESDFTADSKIKFGNDFYSCIDFDSFLEGIGIPVVKHNIRTCVIIKSKTEKYALITSSLCKLKQFSYKDFSLFSDFYCKNLLNKGILACFFEETDEIKKVNYLVDIDKILSYSSEFVK